MLLQYLSTRLVTVCEDVILPGAAGPNVRIFLLQLIQFKPLDMLYTWELLPPKRGKANTLWSWITLVQQDSTEDCPLIFPCTNNNIILISFVNGL